MKKEKVVVLILLSILSGVVIWNIAFRIRPDNDDDLSDAVEGTPKWSYKVVREAKMDILVLGEDPCFQYETYYRKTDQVTEEALKVRDGFRQLVIVIVDQQGKLKLSKEEVSLIDTAVYDQNAYLIVIGEQYSNAWEHEGEGGSYGMVAGNLGISYTYERGSLIKSINFWNLDDKEIFKLQPEWLGDRIIGELEFNLLMNNK